jgi:serine/threonine protein kinase/outer membrane protein assembly factor BamD (BamD/ComL family)
MSSKIGKYEVLDVLGRGGMGVVYKAYDPILDREIALKTMTADGLKDPVLKERFYREARAAGRLRHPNIVTIYELGEENSVPFIAMEYIHGTDIHAVIKGQHEVSFEQKLRIIVQLCRGLAYAHKAGIVHRDVKPSNIRLTDDYQVKILDFGIARLVTSTTMTSGGMVLGTIHYMAPEQIKGAHVDRKSDIFAVGIILFEILTTKKPFDGDNTATVLYNILHEPYQKMNPPIDEQFAVIDRVLKKALDKDPARRYFSADEMGDDLEHFLHSFAPPQRGGQQATTQELLGPKESSKTVEEEKKPLTPYKSDPRITNLLRTAKKQIVEGHAVQAMTFIKQALQIDPNDPDAAQLQSMVEQDIKRAEAEDLLTKGQNYMRESRYDIAMKAFEKILRIQPNHSKARMLLETVKNEMMNPEMEEFISKARKAIEEKKYQDARKLVEEVLKTVPEHQGAYELQVLLKDRIAVEEFNELLGSAEGFIEKQEFDTAKMALEKALKIYPQHPVASKRMEAVHDLARKQQIDKLASRGNKQMELGSYDFARDTFEEILKLEPSNETAKMVIGYIEEKKKVEEVRTLLNQGWRALMMDRKYDEVIQIGEKVLTMDPHNSEARSLIASARNEKGIENPK